MNRKQKIIVSVTGIFLVLLILVGLTYAYFLTRIIGNTNDNSISVTTANLELTYGDGNGVLEVGDKLKPGNAVNFKTSSGSSVSEKTFTVTNDGDDTDYVVIVDNVSITDVSGNTTTFISNDFEYTLTCKSYRTIDYDLSGNSATETNTCDGVSASKFPLANQRVLVGNKIASGITHEYTLTMRYLETNENQSDDMGKTFTARLNIEDITRLENPFVEGTLAYNIINNSVNATNGTQLKNVPLSVPGKSLSSEDEKVLSVSPDELGTSYYYRGSVNDNYLNFAGMCWRIVRIEGDGSAKITLASADGLCNETDALSNKSAFIGMSAYGYDDNKKADYNNSSNRTDVLKYVLENWLSTNFTDEQKALIKSENYCIGDVTTKYDDSFNVIDDEQAATLDIVYYEAYKKLMNDETYSLICSSENKTSETKIAGLTIDEVVLAGAKGIGNINSSYYLFGNAEDNYFLMNIAAYFKTYGDGALASVSDGSINAGPVNTTAYARPTIILNKNLNIKSGTTGTIDNPYEINE